MLLRLIFGLYAKGVSSIQRMEDTSQKPESEVDDMALQLFDHNKKAYKVAVNMMQQLI